MASIIERKIKHLKQLTLDTFSKKKKKKKEKKRKKHSVVVGRYLKIHH
jgi:hypothetical protein